MSWPDIAAYIYTIAWSVSFYGQIYDNYKLKSVQGFSLNYLVLNINGYIIYTIYSSIGFFTTTTGAGTVLVGDLIFTYHAIFAVIIEAIQCCIYPKGKNRIAKQSVIIIFVLWGIIIIEIFFTIFIKIIPWYQYWNPLSLLGYCKLVLSFIKYSPAVYWNYKRKSTKGWSIVNIILDLVGGTFSLASGGLSFENGLNITKIFLAFLTIIYDLIFVFQHYVLYNPKRLQQHQQKNQQKNLLSKDQI